jgi:hypothetical protein
VGRACSVRSLEDVLVAALQTFFGWRRACLAVELEAGAVDAGWRCCSGFNWASWFLVVEFCRGVI